MRVTHDDPDSPTSPLQVDYKKEKGLIWDDFHPEAKARKTAKSSQPHSEPSEPYWKHVADKIQDLRARFANHIPKGGNPRCCNLDRSAVLAVYQEALCKLEHTCDIDARKINLEVIGKVSTILDLRIAQSNDPVFTTEDAFLSPLEPHYAHPRLEYYDREENNGDDSYYRAGFVRLKEWRKEGWPDVYPARAVERERKETAKMRRGGKAMLRPLAVEVLLAYPMDVSDWGEEMNADPNRPWR